jgi:hypothetical protein
MRKSKLQNHMELVHTGKLLVEVSKELNNRSVNNHVGYCPHYREVMDLSDCYFCFFKKIATNETKEMQKP